MADWSSDIEFADGLLGEFGAAMTLRRQGAPSGPAWDRAPAASTNHAIVAVQDDIVQRDRSGTTVLGTTRTLYVRVREGVVPRVGDWIIGPGEAGPGHEVKEVRPVAPGGVSVLFEVDIAR